MLKECNIGTSTIGSMKKGSMPSTNKLATIANYLGVNTEFLLGTTNNPTPPDESQIKPKKGKVLVNSHHYGKGFVQMEMDVEDYEKIIEMYHFLQSQKKNPK